MASAIAKPSARRMHRIAGLFYAFLKANLGTKKAPLGEAPCGFKMFLEGETEVQAGDETVLYFIIHSVAILFAEAIIKGVAQVNADFEGTRNDAGTDADLTTQLINLCVSVLRFVAIVDGEEVDCDGCDAVNIEHTVVKSVRT